MGVLGSDPPLPPAGCRGTQEVLPSAAYGAVFYKKSYLLRANKLTFPFGEEILHFTCDPTGDYREAQMCSTPTKQNKNNPKGGWACLGERNNASLCRRVVHMQGPSGGISALPTTASPPGPPALGQTESGLCPALDGSIFPAAMTSRQTPPRRNRG